jgi:hypothetical protein
MHERIGRENGLLELDVLSLLDWDAADHPRIVLEEQTPTFPDRLGQE